MALDSNIIQLSESAGEVLRASSVTGCVSSLLSKMGQSKISSPDFSKRPDTKEL